MTREAYVLSKGYYFNDEGSLISPSGKEVGKINKEGYKKIKLRINGKQTDILIHRIKAFEKYGNLLYDKGIVTRHLNGNKLDNTDKNIAIGTQLDNINDMPKDLRMRKAIHASSFTKRYDNDEVKLFYEQCKSYKKTMINFNISSKGTLHYILNCR